MDNYEMDYLMKRITKYIEEKTLNNYLNEVVKNNSNCMDCYYNRSGVCFFAFECIKYNFMWYNEKN